MLSYDTVYIAKNVVVHDTVTKLQYLHDTINNVSVVYFHDTIVRINTVVTHDTFLRYNSLYPVPATDSVLIIFLEDTPNAPLKSQYGLDSGAYVNLNSITFTSVIPSPDGSYQTFTTVPRWDSTPGRLHNTRIPSGRNIYTRIIVAPKMLCTVTVNISWSGSVQINMYCYGQFQQQPTTTWTFWGWGKIGGCGGCAMTTVAIPLDDVQDIYVHG